MQGWAGHTGQQDWINHFLSAGGDRIAIPDIDLDRATYPVDAPCKCHTHTRIIRFLAYFGCLYRIGIENDAVIGRDGADILENFFECIQAMLSVTQHVDIGGRPYRNIEPQVEQHGTFQQKGAGMFGDGQAVQHALQAIPGQHLLILEMRIPCRVVAPGQDQLRHVPCHIQTSDSR